VTQKIRGVVNDIDEEFGKLHSKLEDLILDLMDVLDEVDKLWLKARGKSSDSVTYKRDWEALRKLRRGRDGYAD